MKQSDLAKDIFEDLKFRQSLESVLEKLDKEKTLTKVSNFFDCILSDELVYMITSEFKSFEENLCQRDSP